MWSSRQNRARSSPGKRCRSVCPHFPALRYARVCSHVPWILRGILYVVDDIVLGDGRIFLFCSSYTLNNLPVGLRADFFKKKPFAFWSSSSKRSLNLRFIDFVLSLSASGALHHRERDNNNLKLKNKMINADYSKRFCTFASGMTSLKRLISIFLMVKLAFAIRSCTLERRKLQ